MSFHLYEISEIFSSADGAVQFVELSGLADQQQFLAGHQLTASQGEVSRVFSFDADLASGATQGRSVLIATQAFADLGIVTPDYIIPAGFLFTSDGGLDFGEGSAVVNYAALPVDGSSSLNAGGDTVGNSPRNFAGASGFIASGQVQVGGDAADTLSGTVSSDSLAGAGGADALGGLDGNDTLLGGAGNDTLTGGAGIDVLNGGGGNDTYVIDSNDSFAELAGQGSDTVLSPNALALGANFEHLTLTGTSAIDGAGNNAANRVTGNAGDNELRGEGGADTLAGAAGNDTLDGGAGNDRLLGGGGADVYIVAVGDAVVEDAAGGRDLVRSGIAWTLGANLENLTLIGTSAVAATGNALANSLTGNGAANVLSGFRGADLLFGAGGNDVLKGGAGNDRLVGGTGADVFVFESALSAGGNVDTITDFTPGTDRLRLDDDVFTQFAAGVTITASQFRSGAGLDAAQDADDRLIYDTASGALYYDADGAGGTVALPFAQLGLAVHPDLAAADFVVVG